MADHNGRPILWQPSARQSEFLAASEDEVLFGGAAGGGKALELSTPIPTQAGWTTMGELQPGCKVFDEGGAVCTVLAVSEVMIGRPCYEVTFSDGATIVADEGHLWPTLTSAERTAQLRRTPEFQAAWRASRPKRGTGKKPWLAELNAARQQVHMQPPAPAARTTKEIADTLTVGAAGRKNHCIAVARPLTLPDAGLAVDPYILGAWLGDGKTVAGSFTSADPEIVAAFDAAGFQVSKQSGQYAYGTRGLATKLREAGVLGNKHIPGAYLRASQAQRLALLQGLMDTDGYCDARGQCEFTTTRRELADGALELVLSLGIKVTLTEGRATLNGRDISAKYRLKFQTELPAFRLPRKLARQKRAGFRGTHDVRYIVAVRPVPSVPVKCIAVSAPSHCYLAGRAMVPTHNSDALMFDCLGLQFEALKWDKYRAILIRKTYPETEQLFDRASYYYPKIWPGVRANKSDHEFIFPSGAKVQFGYMEREKDRFRYAGDEFQWVGFDELTLHKNDVGYEYLSLFRARSANPRIPVLIRSATNPGNVGHAWVKKRFRIPNDGRPTSFIAERTVIGPDGAPLTVRRSMRFIPSKLSDNTQAPDSFRSAYRNSLLLLPEKDRRKFLDGRWDVMEGQFFTEWDPARHIVQPFEIPKDWPRWRAMDWGTAKPYSVGWYAMDFDGVIYRYRELYGFGGEPNVGTRETAATVAERVKAAEADERRRKISFLNNPADSAMWGQAGHEKSIADEFTSRGIAIRKSSAAEKSRQSGWNECRQRLADGTFKVFASGEHFIRTIPDLQCDPDRDGDLLDDGEDHAGDEWRYSMVSRRPKARKDTRQSPPPPSSGVYLDWLAEQKRLADAGRLTGRIR